ncbi:MULTISPECIES: hypothetical protein [unclassified Sphingobacterium]|uniref:hypothetical protein n=1 Tax=unclassified Sphingobacterium TaxID=2609468 RepID=UPI0025EB8F9B|nr:MULTISPECIES: hypothetical protein [unclassified Sphingobacterium]
MKKITKVLMPICCAFLLSACSSNYLMTFNGGNLKKSEENGTFSFNNDTIQIDYSFAGKEGKVYMKIENKLDKPVLWDLKSSALVINNKAFSYAAESVPIKGQIDGSVTGFRNKDFGTFSEDWVRGYFNGSIGLPKDIVLIPPHAYVDGSYFDLRNDVKEITTSSKKEKVYMYDMNGKSYAVKLAKFKQGESPYNLRNFLSYSVLSDGQAISKTTEQQFYVEQLWQTGAVSLNNIIEIYTKRSDVMAYKEKKGQDALLVGGVVALTAAAVAIDDKQVN